MLPSAFAFAEVSFVVDREPGAPDLPLPKTYSYFAASSSAHPACRFILTGFDEVLPPLCCPDSPTWACETWRLGLSETGDWSIEINAVRGNRWVAVAQVSPDFSMARLRPVSGRQALRSAFALNYPSDQAILTNRLLHFDAAIIHACGIVHRGRGYLFSGRSGIGKTTIARLWRKAGAILLNDDRLIVRHRRGIVEVASTPWHGEDPEITGGIFPLGGIFHLLQGPENSVTPVNGIMASAQFARNTLAPFYSPDGTGRLLGLLDAITGIVPSYNLEFTPDDRAIEACMAAITAAD